MRDRIMVTRSGFKPGPLYSQMLNPMSLLALVFRLVLPSQFYDHASYNYNVWRLSKEYIHVNNMLWYAGRKHHSCWILKVKQSREKESSSIISIPEAEIFPMKKLMRFINRGCMYLLSLTAAVLACCYKEFCPLINLFFCDIFHWLRLQTFFVEVGCVFIFI